MPLTRRNFLVQGSLSVAAGALATLVLEAEEKRGSQETARQYDDWAAVRREFNLAPDYIHLGLFYIASHPRPVREAIEHYRQILDDNPFLTVDRAMFEKQETNLPLQITQAEANYIAGDAQDTALTQKTPSGHHAIYRG